MFSMHKLVNNYIVLDFERQHKQDIVEADIMLCVATTPLAFVRLYRKSVYRYPHTFRNVSGKRKKTFGKLFNKSILDFLYLLNVDAFGRNFVSVGNYKWKLLAADIYAFIIYNILICIKINKV